MVFDLHLHHRSHRGLGLSVAHADETTLRYGDSENHEGLLRILNIVAMIIWWSRSKQVHLRRRTVQLRITMLSRSGHPVVSQSAPRLTDPSPVAQSWVPV
jgi:hypothetical protein